MNCIVSECVALHSYYLISCRHRVQLTLHCVFIVYDPVMIQDEIQVLVIQCETFNVEASCRFQADKLNGYRGVDVDRVQIVLVGSSISLDDG